MKNNFKVKPIIIINLIIIMALFALGIPFKVFAKISERDEYKNIYSEYENMYQDISMKSIYEKNQSILFKKVNELNIDNEILQDGIINELSCISRRNNIELNSIKFSEAMLILSDNTGISMKVTVDFDSDFNDMLNFVDDVKNSETIISVTDISISMIENNKVHVSVNIMFYALPMIQVQ